jgi:hypothetical protein
MRIKPTLPTMLTLDRYYIRMFYNQPLINDEISRLFSVRTYRSGALNRSQARASSFWFCNTAYSFSGRDAGTSSHFSMSL